MMTPERREFIIARLRRLDSGAKRRLLDRIVDFVSDAEPTAAEAREELLAAGIDPDTVAQDILKRVRAALAEG